MNKNNSKIAVIKTNQSYRELFSIQLAGWLGIPTLASSILVLEQNSLLGSMLTIIVGNSIMWFIRLGIISMSHTKHQSTLDLSKAFLGKTGGYFVSVVLLISTLGWYFAETAIGGNALTHLISIHESPNIDQFSQVSIFLGVVSTVLCLDGMDLLKKLSIFSLPILIVTFFTILFSISEWNFETRITGVSLSGLSIFLATNLGISSDLPTFFRHSRSWTDSIKALTYMQVTSMLFGVLSLHLWTLVMNDFSINNDFVLSSGNYLLRYSLIIFIFCSVICSNVANIYSASVGWELLAPSALLGKKEYLIMGLGLAILFILTSGLFDLDIIINTTDAMLANLCIVLSVGSIIHKKYNKMPQGRLQVTLLSAWVFASGLNTLQFLYKNNQPQLIVALIAIALIISLSMMTSDIRK